MAKIRLYTACDNAELLKEFGLDGLDIRIPRMQTPRYVCKCGHIGTEETCPDCGNTNFSPTVDMTTVWGRGGIFSKEVTQSKKLLSMLDDPTLVPDKIVSPYLACQVDVNKKEIRLSKEYRCRAEFTQTRMSVERNDDVFNKLMADTSFLSDIPQRLLKETFRMAKLLADSQTHQVISDEPDARVNGFYISLDDDDDDDDWDDEDDEENESEEGGKAEPKKLEEKKEEEHPIMRDIGILSTLYSIAVQKRGGFWALSDEELVTYQSMILSNSNDFDKLKSPLLDIDDYIKFFRNCYDFLKPYYAAGGRVSSTWYTVEESKLSPLVKNAFLYSLTHDQLDYSGMMCIASDIQGMPLPEQEKFLAFYVRNITTYGTDVFRTWRNVKEVSDTHGFPKVDVRQSAIAATAEYMGNKNIKSERINAFFDTIDSDPFLALDLLSEKKALSPNERKKVYGK